MELNLTVPDSWSALSSEQLAFVYQTMTFIPQSLATEKFKSADDYSAQVHAAIAIHCLCRWTGLKVVAPYGDGFLMKYKNTKFSISAGDLAATLSVFDWMRNPPPFPVRLERIGDAHAVCADISGLSFDSYLSCDNLWQGYLCTRDEELLRQMAEILYDREGIAPAEYELLSIFHWWMAVKAHLSASFPHFLRPASSDASTPDFTTLRRNVDAQIRALTKGDITKEAEVLSLDVWRALTELDAQAREYEELNKKFNKPS